MSAAPSDAACRRLDHLQRRHARVGPAQGRSPAGGEEPVEDPAGRARLHSGARWRTSSTSPARPSNALETGRYDPSLPLAFRIARLFAEPIEAIFSPDDESVGTAPGPDRRQDLVAIRGVATTAGRSAAPADGIDSGSDPPYGDAVSGSREAAAPERIRGPAMWAAVVACGAVGRSGTQRVWTVSERCATGPRGRAARRSADRAAASRLPPGPSRRGWAAARPAGSRGWRSAT